MDKNKDLAPEIEEVETPEVDNVNTNDTDPNIMAVLRRKEEEQRQKDAERNKWLKIGGIVLAAILIIVAMIFSLRSCSGNNDKPEDSAEHEHTYVETVVPPTETEDGYTLYSCEECGDSYKDNTVEALGQEKQEEQEGTESTTESTDKTETKPSETDKKPTDTNKNPTTSKPTTSKPTTSTDDTSSTTKPTNPTTPSKPSNDKTSDDQDSKPSKPTEDTSSTTKPTEPEDTTPSTPSTPSEPTTPPAETKCPHETTQYSGCRWNVSGCSCSHKHVEQKVGSYTHIYCEDVVSSHREGKTVWYAWKYYTEAASNNETTSSNLMTSRPTTSTAPESAPSETTSSTTSSNSTTSAPTEDTPSKETTTSSVPTEPSVEEETGCNHEHTGGCRYEQGYNCEHNHVEQKVGSRIHVYCEDVTVAHRDGKTYYYPWELYN